MLIINGGSGDPPPLPPLYLVDLDRIANSALRLVEDVRNRHGTKPSTVLGRYMLLVTVSYLTHYIFFIRRVRNTI